MSNPIVRLLDWLFCTTTGAWVLMGFAGTVLLYIIAGSVSGVVHVYEHVIRNL